MSTLKAARADNFYYPSDGAEDHRKQRLRMRKTPKRTRKFDIPLGGDESDIRWSGRGTVIRFEMPFKVICQGCQGYIAKGVRFDAERKAIGKYLTTTIYAFRMSCLFCHTRIVIETDPKRTDYICREGIVKKIEEFDVADAQTVAVGYELAEKQLRASDPFYVLEQSALASSTDSSTGNLTYTESSVITGSRGRAPESSAGESEGALEDRLVQLEQLSSLYNKDDYLSNCVLRRRFRTQKKLIAAEEAKNNPNVSLELVPELPADVEAASRVKFLSQSKSVVNHLKRASRRLGGIFEKSSVSSGSVKSCAEAALESKRKRLEFIKLVDSKYKSTLEKGCSSVKLDLDDFRSLVEGVWRGKCLKEFEVAELQLRVGSGKSVEVVDCSTGDLVGQIHYDADLGEVRILRWFLPWRATLGKRESGGSLGDESRQRLGIVLVTKEGDVMVLGQKEMFLKLHKVGLVGVDTVYLPEEVVGDVESGNVGCNKGDELLGALVMVYADARVHVWVPWYDYKYEFFVGGGHGNCQSCESVEGGSAAAESGTSGSLILLAVPQPFQTFHSGQSTLEVEELLSTTKRVECRPLVVVAFECGTVAVVDVATRGIVSSFQVVQAPRCMAITIMDGKLLIAVGWGNELAVYNAEGEVVYQRMFHKSGEGLGFSGEALDSSNGLARRRGLLASTTSCSGALKDDFDHSRTAITEIKVSTEEPSTFLVKLDTWHSVTIPKSCLPLLLTSKTSRNFHKIPGKIPSIICIANSLLNPRYLFCANSKGELLLICDGAILNNYGNPFKSRTLKIICHPRLPSIFAIALKDGSVFMIFLEPENPVLFHYTFLMKIKPGVESLTWFLTTRSHGTGHEINKKTSRDAMVQRTWLALNRCSYDSLVVSCNLKEVFYCNVNGSLRPWSVLKAPNLAFCISLSWPIYSWSSGAEPLNLLEVLPQSEGVQQQHEGLNWLGLPLEQHLGVGTFINGRTQLKILKCDLDDATQLTFSQVDVIEIPMFGKPTCVAISNKQYNQHQRFSRSCPERLLCVNPSDVNCVNPLQEFIAIGDQQGHLYTCSLFALYNAVLGRKSDQESRHADEEGVHVPLCRARLPFGISQLSWATIWKNYDPLAVFSYDCLCSDDVKFVFAVVFSSGDLGVYNLTCGGHPRIFQEALAARELHHLHHSAPSTLKVISREYIGALDVFGSAGILEENVNSHNTCSRHFDTLGASLQLSTLFYAKRTPVKACCFIERCAPSHFQLVIAGQDKMSCLVVQPDDLFK